MSNEISPSERRELAEATGLNEQYLYQCLTGRRDLDAAEAARVERETSGRLRRWMLRRDWQSVWPELVGTEGSPSVDASTSTPAKAGA
jgi:DNA-binding transcriptional regulator YdaS (Cro superfamily)